MKPLFEVTLSNGQAWYDLFYFLATGMVGLFFLLYGNRRNYPLAAWSMIFVTGILFFIAGTKLVMYDAEDWWQLLSSGQLAPAPSRSVLGGILLGTFGIWLAKKLLHFPYPVLDALAIGLPAGMAIQRIGCFLAGCCYGTPTEVPWSVTYSIHAPAFHDHLAQGWIDPASIVSMPVHPIQLYQTLLCLLIAFAVWRLQHLFRRPGSLFFFSVGSYLAVRFLVEFWNSPETGWLESVDAFTLKNIQWILLVGTILLFLVIRRRERRAHSIHLADDKMIGTAIPFLCLILVCLVISYWLTPVESLVIQMTMLPAWFFQLRATLPLSGRAQGKWTAGVYAVSLAFLFTSVLTGQRLYSDLTDNDHDRNTFYEISGGFGQLNYDHYHEAPTANQGCYGGTYYTPTGPIYRQKQQAFGAGFKSIKTVGRFKRVEYSGLISGGWDKDLDDPTKSRIGAFDIGGGVKFDQRWFGFGLGLHSGSAMHNERRKDISYTTEHAGQWYVSLSGSVRVFPYDILYCEVRYNDLLPYQITSRASALTQLLLGSGLGLKNGTAIEIGTDLSGGIFFGGKAIINNRYGLHATIYARRAAREAWQVSNIGLIYRFRK